MSDETRKATCVALGTTVCLSLGEFVVQVTPEIPPTSGFSATEGLAAYLVSELLAQGA